MEEETMLALNQDARLFLRSIHVREINRVILKRRKVLYMDLFWRYNFAVRDLKQCKADMEKRFNIFRWLDWKWLERAQKRYDEVVAEVHAAGLEIKEERYNEVAQRAIDGERENE